MCSLRSILRGKFEILYISSPLQATRRNVLDPSSLVAYVAGENINPIYPLRTSEVDAFTKSIDEELAHIGDNEDGKEITIQQLIGLIERCPVDSEVSCEMWNMKMIRVALETIQGLLKSDKAYLVVRRGRDLTTHRRERQGIISGRPVKESDLAPADAPTLFLYRQNPTSSGEAAVWWPQLRFPEGQKNYVLSFSIDGEEEINTDTSEVVVQ